MQSVTLVGCQSACSQADIDRATNAALAVFTRSSVTPEYALAQVMAMCRSHPYDKHACGVWNRAEDVAFSVAFRGARPPPSAELALA